MADGRSKQVRKYGATPNKASNALRKKLQPLAADQTSGEITGDTRFAKICDLWVEEIRRDHQLGHIAAATVRHYDGYIKNWIKPALGELQAREVRAMACDNLIQRGRNKSYGTANSLRTVLSRVCAFAVRYGAMAANPVKSTSRLSQGKRSPVKVMALAQRLDLLAKLEALAQERSTDALGRSIGKRSQVWTDLPDILRGALATGARLGELLALEGNDIDSAQPTVTLAHHLVRVTGKGLVREENRKGNGDGLILLVPEWSVPMWRRRKLASGGGPLFPAWNGQWPDPGNTFKRIRRAMDSCGYDWVTSHVWRKTVSTVLDEANLPTTAIADQLGNTPAVVEQHYRRKRIANQATAAALEGIFPTPETG